MFSSLAIGLLVAISSGTWVYTKVMRRTGNNNKSSLITAGIFAAMAFIVTVTVVWSIDSMIGK